MIILFCINRLIQKWIRSTSSQSNDLVDLSYVDLYSQLILVRLCILTRVPSRSVTAIFNRVGLPGVMQFPPFPHIVHLSPSCRRMLSACLGSCVKAGIGRVWVVCKGHSQFSLGFFCQINSLYGTCTSIFILHSWVLADYNLSIVTQRSFLISPCFSRAISSHSLKRVLSQDDAP